MPIRNTPVNILCIEDSAFDRVLIREFFECKTLKCNFTFMEDGVDALTYLREALQREEVATPDLILLDLNLPKIDGREVLKAIKSNPKLAHIPVIVLSTSEARQDIAKSYALHANCYLVKPSDIDDFKRTMDIIEKFWLETAELCEGKDCA